MKLSKAQQSVIDYLKSGGIIHYIDGLNAKCFRSDNYRNISWATIYKLETLGLVKRTNRKIELIKTT